MQNNLPPGSESKPISQEIRTFVYEPKLEKRLPVIFPESTQQEHAAVAKDYLVKAKRLRVERQAPKIKAFRRKMSSMRAKPVPDAGIVYERVNPNGSIRRYKVQPNGEWRRVKD